MEIPLAEVLSDMELCGFLIDTEGLEVFGREMTERLEKIQKEMNAVDLRNMKVLVLSCDRNADLFEPFHHCIEKYWESHPEVIYSTESVTNPYYKTICKNYELSQWTRRIRETLTELHDEQVLVMVDDYFIRQPVDEGRIAYASEHLKGNIAVLNFEKAYDPNDKDTALDGFKMRQHGADYEVSIMCGLWQREKLIAVLDRDCDPWTIELEQDSKGFDYYINSSEYIIDGGYKTWQYMGIKRGKWCRKIVPFFEKEGIEVDYSIRGFADD